MTPVPVLSARMAAVVRVNKSDNTLLDDGTSSRFEVPHASSLTTTVKIDRKRATTTDDNTQTFATRLPFIAQPSDPCATNPSNENIHSGLHPTKTIQSPAGRVTGVQGPITRQQHMSKGISMSTMMATDDGGPPSGIPSPKSLSPEKQPEWPQDVAGRPRNRRKQSAAEMFPRTDHRDREECWDESCFWGSEEDQRVLKEFGEEGSIKVMEKEAEAPVSRVCRDPY